MVPIKFPTIDIRTYNDIDIIVNYFRSHGSQLDDIVESWIEDIIEDKPILVNYYRSQMKKAVFRYRSMSNHCYRLGNKGTIRENIDKLKRFKNNIEQAIVIKNKRYARISAYNVITLHQPVASMVVSGLLKVIKGDGMPFLNEGETVFVYAKEITEESIKELWADQTIYGSYHNALNMGNIANGELLPKECYVGFIKIGKRTKNGYYGIKEAEIFDNIVKDLSKGIHAFKSFHANKPKLTFEKNILRIPLNDVLWNDLNNMKGHFYFYWKSHFDEFYSSKYGFGNTNGLYDIIFLHGTEEKRFEQNDNTALSKEILESPSDKREFLALCINLQQLSPPKDSSFDILQKKDWILDWNCVKFKQGYFIVLPPDDGSVKFKPQAVSSPGVLESYNYLKEYLNDRLQPVYCSVEGMKLTIYDKIRLNEAIEKFTTASRQRAIKTGGTPSTRRIAPLQMSFKQALSKAQEMTPEDFQKYKSKYIDFLVMLQSKKYKVIPCVERLSHANSDITEYAFMFSIECSTGRILIVHENINPDRSTLLFLVKDENFNNSIKEIYDFLQGAEINKRSSLRDKSIDIKNAGIVHYRSINHDDLYSWKQTINTYKRYR